jgi:hypothetical protein
MIHKIALFVIFGQPLIFYSGILALLALLFTATVGAMNFRGIATVPFRWHPRLAITTITIALVHAVFGLSLFYNF